MVYELGYRALCGRAYLCRAEEGCAPTLKVKVDNVEDGWLSLDGRNYKISGGAAYVPTRNLTNGVHMMSVDGDGGRLDLGQVRVLNGTVSLDITESVLAQIGRELHSLADINLALAESVVKLEDAVFGRKIL